MRMSLHPRCHGKYFFTISNSTTSLNGIIHVCTLICSPALTLIYTQAQNSHSYRTYEYHECFSAGGEKKCPLVHQNIRLIIHIQTHMVDIHD